MITKEMSVRQEKSINQSINAWKMEDRGCSMAACGYKYIHPVVLVRAG